VNLRYGDFDGALRDAPALMAFGPASIETIDGTVLGLARRDGGWHEVREFFPDDPEGPAQAVNLIELAGHDAGEVEAALGGSSTRSPPRARSAGAAATPSPAART
jgi:hypothetical protein